MAMRARRPGNLPAEVSSFVGRRRPLADLRRLLTAARLVSLVGPGGVGKSRLAVRVAAELGRGFPGGTWLVELADVRDPGMVASAVAAALDLRDQAGAPLDLVLTCLRDRELLLIVDNCEHLLDAVAAVVATILATAPGVRVITTSREPLGVAGEHVVPVAPLDLPGSGQAVIGQPAEAVVLFAQRAAAASGRFELTEANQADVVDLCRRLDGLPLAIELAAGRTRVLTVRQILDRLTDRFGLLTGGGRAALPRHQTLRTTMEWSHDLLADDERVLFRRLAVFASRFTLVDVESVCASDDLPVARVLDVLASLVDKSLVMREDVGYRLHETTREFAGLKSRSADETAATERRCDEYYRTACRKFGRDARFRLVECLEWMDLEIDNVRSVLRRCVDRDIVVGLGWYWITRATAEGVRWLDALMAGGDPAVCYLRGFLALLQSDPATARPAFDRATEWARRAGHRLLPESLAMASVAANMAGEHESAGRLLDEARCVVAGDDVASMLSVCQARALHGLFVGDLAVARVAAAEGVRLARAAGDRYGLEMMLMNLGSAALRAGDLDEATARFAESLRIAAEIDDRVAQYYLLDALGCRAARSGDPRLAARLLGAAETVRAGAGAHLIPTLAPLVAGARESAGAALGPARFDAEFAAGQHLDRDAAIVLALGDAAPTTTDTPRLAPLGHREADVARLVADGLSNKQIGTRLFISQRTVDSHVRNILNKLGFHSRTQIAAWVRSPDA